MLYIIERASNSSEEREIRWRVGERLHMDFHAASNVIEVQADGDELIYILREFSLICYPKDRKVIRWFGDMAKFIVANLV